MLSLFLTFGLVVGSGCSGRTLRLGIAPDTVDAAGTGDTRGNGGSDGATSDASSDGPRDATACAHATIKADEVVWIGDGWLTTGVQVTNVRDQARAIGAIGPSDDYVDLAANGATISAVASQYSVATSATRKPKVLIMDGGTVDTIGSGTSDATVKNVTSAFGQLLAKLAADGTVGHIIYIMVPELPAITGVTVLRSPLKQACAQSAVPCHFLDLQPIWAEGGVDGGTGHPEYTASNGILPTTSGAQAMAMAIWSTMQSNCIAQ